MRSRALFVARCFAAGLGSLTSLYQWYVSLIAVALVAFGVSAPPVVHWVSLAWTLPIGVVVLAVVLVEGAYRRAGQSEPVGGSSARTPYPVPMLHVTRSHDGDLSNISSEGGAIRIDESDRLRLRNLRYTASRPSDEAD